MSELQIAVLALVQGITEFLPISSSGHLILVPVLTGWPDQGLLIDVAVHVGSLGAVLLYWRHDVSTMLRGLGEWRTPDPLARSGRRLIALIMVGTVPVVIAGAVVKAVGTQGLRSAAVVGWSSLAFGVLLYVIDRRAPNARTLDGLGFGGAFVIGLAQILALIPGTSRAGITITAARWLGLQRDEAAHFSMLLSIPTVLAAGAVLALDVIELGAARSGGAALFAAALAFASALAAIALMMRWLQRATYTPFVVYRCLLGLGLLAYAYG